MAIGGVGKGIGSPVPPRTPKAPRLETPNYTMRTPIVNDNHFVDGNPPIATPTIGSPAATFNPGAKSGLPPPARFVQAPGKRVYGTKGLTNKRQTSNI